MHNQLEKYLSQIEKQLAALPVEQRQEELREIRSHLEMMIDVNIARGFDAEEAVTKAIKQFGSAQKVGKELRQSKPFSWLHYLRPFAAFLFALCVVIAWISISSGNQIPSFVPAHFQWLWQLMLIIIIFPLTGWMTEVIAPKMGFYSVAVLFFGILSLFISVYFYFSFWKFEQIFIAYFLFGFLHNALAGIASFLGVWARCNYVERNQQQPQITAE